ncbi:hypothetical protein MMC29_008025 [Sticta canariensis]|nr:hypothetical protein [Sticta canariensis]
MSTILRTRTTGDFDIEYVVQVSPAPERWLAPTGWQILKDFIRDHITHQPGKVELFQKGRGPFAEASCRITDREDAHKAYNALINVKWDDRYLSVVLTEHYPTSNSSNSPKPPLVLERHDGSETNAKILYTSNTSRESTPATTSHRRCSSEQSVRSERTASPLYRGPFHLVPINVSYFTGDQRARPNPPHASRLHGRQVHSARFSSVNASSMSPASHLTTNQMVYCAVQSDSYACSPNTQAFNTRFPRLALSAPNEHGAGSMARSGQQGGRRNEGSSSCATFRPERTGPIIVKTPE